MQIFICSSKSFRPKSITTSNEDTHSHLLTKGVDITLIDKCWTKSNLGFKKFIPDHKIYEKDKGANFYIAKYIDKEIDYDYV